MKVYVFGNPDFEGDNAVYNLTDLLSKENGGIEFIKVGLSDDLPLNEEKIIILDAVEGIDKVELLDEKDIDKLVVAKSVSAHDWDLGFQLKYLKKLGKLNKVTIIGIPKGKKTNYSRIHSILRKLVEQEMQGS